MKENSENYFIDFLRFVFSICILFYHSWLFTGIFGNGFFNYGYLGVDFYFIVTGYLMIQSIYKHPLSNDTSILKDSFQYITRKFKNLFPALLISFIIGIFFVYNLSDLKLSFILSNHLLPELFQLSVLGYDLNINSSWWYISSMFLALSVLYPIARKYNKDYGIYLAPVLLVFTLGLVYTKSININDPTTISFFLRNGFYKAIIFIILGNISFYITDKIKHISFSNRVKIILSIVEFVLYSLLFLNLHFMWIDTFIFAILMMISISLSFSNITYLPKKFKNSFWKKLGNYGFYIYLCNISIRTFMIHTYMNYQNACCFYSYKYLSIHFVLISCVVALFIYILVEIIYKRYFLSKFKNR